MACLGALVEQEETQRLKQRKIDARSAPKCAGRTKKGRRCARKAVDGDLCYQHAQEEQQEEEAEKEGQAAPLALLGQCEMM